MAVTYRDLWPQFISWDNLLLAYRKCRRRKRYKRAAVGFDFDWEANLRQLQNDLANEDYQPGPYHHFIIHEPKRRKISAAPFRDRILHHALVNVLEPIYEPRFIHDSYACRPGKGTHRALDRAQHYLRRHSYYLKTDVVKFFPSIDHEVLLRVLERRIADPRLMKVIRVVLASGEGVLDEEANRVFFPGDDLFSVLRPIGLPIGNLTSQFFANVLLDQFDHFVKEELRVRGYVRYADDLVVFGDAKRELWDVLERLQQRLDRYRLKLHDRKTQVLPTRQGLKFLGFKLWPDTRRLQQSTLIRFNRRLRRQKWLYRHRRLRPASIGRSVAAWSAHTQHANSAGIRRLLMRRVRFPTPLPGP